MSYQEYIKAELLILIPVLYFIGMALKKSKMKDKLIPFILGVISIFLCTIYILATEPIRNPQDVFAGLFCALTQGVLIAGASVYANQIIKQAGKD